MKEATVNNKVVLTLGFGIISIPAVLAMMAGWPGCWGAWLSPQLAINITKYWRTL